MSITVFFFDQSKPGPSGPITDWDWDFGDGGTSTDQNPSHAYATAGTYSVSLTVTGSGSDGTSSVTHSALVDDPAALTANFSSSASGLVVTFTDASAAGPSGPITGWAWNFGDSGTSSSQNPTHTYAAGGTYTVTLTVTGTSPDGTANTSKGVTVSGASPSAYKPYTAASAFNKAIPSPAPVHPLSSSWISAANNWLLGGTANDAYKEWLGPRKRVLYWRGDTSTLSTVAVYNNWTPAGGYACASSATLDVPMPSDFAGLLSSTNVSGDHCVAIADSSTGDVWEMYLLTPPGVTSRNVSCSSSRWNSIGLNRYKTDTTLGTGYTELTGTFHVGFASESYCHINAGMLTPEDFADLGNTNAIPHALAFIVSDHCTSNGTGGSSYPRKVSPARGGIGFSATGMPYGARLQLDPTLNIDTWTSINAKTEPWRTGLKKICKALQTYGMFIVDGSGGIGAGGINAANQFAIADHTYNGRTGWKYPWDTAGYGWSYSNGLPYDLMAHFRVIDFTKWTGV